MRKHNRGKEREKNSRTNVKTGDKRRESKPERLSERRFYVKMKLPGRPKSRT
jgi:hypothetical protein